jgi:hypothetical protein
MKVLLCTEHYQDVLFDVITRSEWEVGAEMDVEITTTERCEVCQVEAAS